jgi:hypothetical protein
MLIAAASAHSDELQKLDEFLGRLGLNELRLHHLERRLDAESDAAKRSSLSKLLVDRYVEALLDAADDAERFTALRAKVETLITVNPAARTGELDIVLLQAEYQQAEAAVIAWQEDPKSNAGLADAKATLAKIQPLLATQQETLAAAAEKTAESIDGLKTEPERQTAQRQLARQQTLAARAEYFAGWSAYYLGVTRQDAEAAKSDYETAKRHFTRLLDVSDEDDYKLVEAEGLGLESIWRARAVIGLGLSEIGTGRLPAGQRVLSWLSHAAVAPNLREQAPYWHLRGLLTAERWTEAAELAAGEVASFTSMPSSGKSSFCVTAIRAGARLATGPAHHTLVITGVTGLARMRLFEALEKLTTQFKLDEGDLAGDFHLTWIRGRRQYLAAEKSRDAAQFQTAASTLTAALNAPEAHEHMAEAAQARYYLAWTRYRLGDLDSATQLFTEAASTLRATSSDVAAQALWMRTTCLVERAQKDPRQTAAAITALQSFKQEFPSAPEAERIDLIVARLRQTRAAGEESLAELARVKPDDPTYASAQVEICRIQHQLWSQAKSDATKARSLANDLLTSVRRLLTSSATFPDDYRLKATLLAVDALRHSQPPDWSQIGSLLDRVEGDAEAAPATMSARVEYAYRRLEHAQERGDSTEVHQQATWIAEHGVSTPYELPALIVVARAADQAVAKATGSERTERVTEARQTYDRLVKLLGESPQAFSSSKNALAAASKLAQYDEELARWPTAADRLTRLLAAQPADRRFLRRAALATYNAGRHAESLNHWRTLLNGLEPGSDEWLEAKAHQIKCLQQTNPVMAEKTLNQLKLLYPNKKLP